MINLLTIYGKYWISEWARPINYITALIVGLLINFLQSREPFTSVVPFVIPMLVQSFARAGVRYKNRFSEILLLLPEERSDPAFVMNKNGQIIASAGKTQSYFKKNNIHSIFDIFKKDDLFALFIAVDGTRGTHHVESLELHSSPANKWYLVQVKAVSEKPQVLVWLQDITKRKMLDLRLSVIRGFSEDIPLEALIVSLADKYDALRGARSYKPALTHDQTCALLMKDDRSGSRGEDIFGPELIALFLEIHEAFERIYEDMID